MKELASNAPNVRQKAPGATYPCPAVSLRLCAPLARCQGRYKSPPEGHDAH